MIIYKITNLINGKIYVGQTTRTLNQRLSQHRSHKHSLISKAIHKYGWENFKAEVVEECSTIEELNEREKYWIAYYDCISPKDYNRTSGGTGNGHLSPEFRKYLSEINTGKHHTPETRAKTSQSLPAYYAAHPEISEQLSKSHKKYYEEHPEAREKKSIESKGRKHTPESKQKIADALTKFYSDPANRVMMSEVKKKYYEEHPEAGERTAEANRKRIHTPESRARQAEAARKRIAKKKAEKEFGMDDSAIDLFDNIE